MKNKNKKLFLLLLFSLLTLPSRAYANSGIPMLVLAFPFFIVLLIPIICIEAYIFKRAHFSWNWSLKWSAIANIFTTLVGIPLTWVFLTILEIIIYIIFIISGGNCPPGDTLYQKLMVSFFQAPWPACTGGGIEAIEFILHTAFLILLIPFFFSSWKLESLIIRKMNKNTDPILIEKLTLKANLITYALLMLIPTLFFMFIPPLQLFIDLLGLVRHVLK
jgi:hypothetical protein